MIVVWEALAQYVHNPFVLPTLGSILSVLLMPTADLLGSGSLLENARVSLFRVALGFLIAAFLAVPLGVAMGQWGGLKELSEGLISALRPVPPLAWVPLAMAWLKIGLASVVFIIALGAFFPILLSTMQGVRSVKRSWQEAVWMMGANDADLIAKVILPGSAPEIWTGMRVGFGIAWMCVVAAEMLPGTSSGLGYLIMYAYGWGQIQVVVAGMVAIGLLGILIDRFFMAVERRWFSWRASER
ncbi:MAG: taurine transporter subunit [Methanosaeta sp. PtaU1.Bin112]|nr:MAG: taurine transporter subunit [Methanosaeta sp. PtaU1.Bin112]